MSLTTVICIYNIHKFPVINIFAAEQANVKQCCYWWPHKSSCYHAAEAVPHLRAGRTLHVPCLRSIAARASIHILKEPLWEVPTALAPVIMAVLDNLYLRLFFSLFFENDDSKETQICITIFTDYIWDFNDMNKYYWPWFTTLTLLNHSILVWLAFVQQPPSSFI